MISNQMTEEDYPFLINELMKYIIKIKNIDTELSLIDIIYDYAFRNELDVELVGDAIANDIYFKSFIEKDCQYRNIIESDENQMEDW